MHLGAGEIAVLLVLALLLFGAKRLPQVGRAAGEAIREFKAAFYGRPKGLGDADGGGPADGENKDANTSGHDAS